MKKQTPFLDFYKKYYGREMPAKGLCGSLQENETLKMLSPTDDDLYELYEIWLNTRYWGSDDEFSKMYIFTPLRQNIVLLCAALNDEL